MSQPVPNPVVEVLLRIEKLLAAQSQPFPTVQLSDKDKGVLDANRHR